MYPRFLACFLRSPFVLGRPPLMFPFPGTGRRRASHFQATAYSVDELQQAVLPRLHAAQFFRREYAQLCTEMTLRLSPMCAFHRFPSLAEISSFESVQLSLAQSEKSVHFAPCLPFFQAPLHRCGLLVFSPVDCFSPRSRGAFRGFQIIIQECKRKKEARAHVS